jgi:2-polyprenyl-3-methyl-5-hydroxy-6-metoxy-1,4-benzoquinol methylase
MTSPDEDSAEGKKVCPLCRGLESSLFDQRNFRSQLVTNWLCLQCGCVYQYPYLTGNALDAFYEREYRQLYQGSEGPSLQDLAVQEKRAVALLDFIRKQGIQISRHLDIGSSAGILLKQFQAGLDTQGVGVEPGEAYRKYALEHGMITYASLEDLDQEGEPRFDLVSLVHVVEHLPDPTGYLRKIRDKYLTATGWLLIEVPNLYAHDCFEIAHLVSFSEHTLGQTLLRAGYAVKAFEKHGRPRSARIPLYLTMLGQPDEATEKRAVMPAKKESRVRWRRKMGLIRRRLVERVFPHQAWKPVG